MSDNIIEIVKYCFSIIEGSSMHSGSFVIKVGDLLRNPGKSDEVMFEHLSMPSLPELTSDGVSGTILIQGINDSSLRVTIVSLVAYLHDRCDVSGEEFDRGIELTDKDIMYSLSINPDDFENQSLYDNLFPWDGSYEALDLEEGIRQLIQLERPVVVIKPGKEYILDQYDLADDENQYT